MSEDASPHPLIYVYQRLLRAVARANRREAGTLPMRQASPSYRLLKYLNGS